jgi:hypothetical protein
VSEDVAGSHKSDFGVVEIRLARFSIFGLQCVTWHNSTSTRDDFKGEGDADTGHAISTISDFV